MVLGAISIAEHVHRVAERYPIHVALHTDHCQADKLDTFVMPLVEETERRRAAGRPNLFNGHMFDGSALPLEGEPRHRREAARALREERPHPRNRSRRRRRRGGRRPASAAAKLYTTPEDTLEVARRLNAVQGARYLLAATFGNVHGVYKPGHVKLKPSILKDCQDAVVEAFGEAARFYFVFHGGSGSELRDIHEALDYGVVKMNVDTDMQYAFTRAIADHFFKNYDGVLKVDGEVGNKKAYDPRSYLALAEQAMAERVKRAATELRSAGTAMVHVSRQRGTQRDGGLDFTIARLGECRVPSPMSGVRFTGDDERVLYHSTLEDMKPWLGRRREPPAMESAGPRETLFFDPSTLACGIVTCGGLCPGLNDVIRAIVLSLHHHYGVRKVYGFRFGFEGLVRRMGHEPLELTPETVNRIHEIGGSILGSSRGPAGPGGDGRRTCEELGIGILFAIGGDGTLRGAQAIGEEAARRGVKIGVIGVPKTIDNDVSFVQRTFGFETAVSEARRATYAANAEAEAARNGIGLVKLMGRDSGFIAAYSALVDGQVNFCLVPEVPFTLEGFLSELQRRLERRGHAVIVVAEGAGQDLMAKEVASTRRATSGTATSASFCAMRSQVLHADRHARSRSSTSIPSYTIRSLPATAHDSAFCLLLGQNAVHAGISGRTNMVVSFWNHQFTHVPIALAASERKKIDPEGALWNSVLAVHRSAAGYAVKARPRAIDQFAAARLSPAAGPGSTAWRR